MSCTVTSVRSCTTGHQDLLIFSGFQLWDSIQAICSYVRGILSSQAMLTGVGVGQQASQLL